MTTAKLYLAWYFERHRLYVGFVLGWSTAFIVNTWALFIML